MSTELSRPLTLVNPSTGEALTLDAPTDDLARFLADMREHDSLAREAKSLVQHELLARFDKSAQWTQYAAGFKLSAPASSTTEEFDGPALREALLALVDEGLLTADAVDRAVETVVTYEPRKRGINALRKLGGRVAAVVDDHVSVVDARRYVKVERA